MNDELKGEAMSSVIDRILYTAEATVEGGREGHARTSDGRLDVDLDVPTEMGRSEEHTSELQSQSNLVCRLLLEKKKNIKHNIRRVQRLILSSRNIDSHHSVMLIDFIGINM